MSTKDILVSQKFNNYNYAPGIATYGIDGKTGESGKDGNNIYFTDFNLKDITDLKYFASQLIQNYLPLENSTVQIERTYKNNDLFFDQLGIIYRLKNIESLLNNDSLTSWDSYFDVAGRLSIANNSSLFTMMDDNRLILNSSLYGGYDIISGLSYNDASNNINKNSVVNIISNKVNENNDIEMINIQSIDDIDVEDGKLSVYYKTTENAFYLDSNKPIIINGDVKLNNDEPNIEYDNYSTILTSSDTISYFKHVCDKLEYTIIYNSSINQYKIVVYSTESEIDDQEKIIDYLAKRNETVFGKIYTNENDQILIKFEKAYNNDNPPKPYLFGYVPQGVSSITTFSLIHNTEVFLTYKEGGPSLDEMDLTKYSSLKLMRYNAFYYGFFKDEQVIIPDESCYYEYTGETVEYNNQLCYIWTKYFAYGEETENDYEAKLLTNSLNLSLPFTQNSPEFVASLTVNNTESYGHRFQFADDDNNYPSSYKLRGNDYEIEINSDNFILPENYQGLRILRKTL